ncbi:MAG: shikimate dehydrogenase [Gammaproteobacteria bacterium]|nr:shikimate dehydrogenase [Gammaproteobacteria bacterium]
MKLHFAVIGNPINHSLSPRIHQSFAEQLGINLSYKTIQAENQTFKQTVIDFFKQGGKGLNITMPFKQLAFDLATVHTARCQQAKAANTLWMSEGHLHADITDGIGLIRDLSRHLSLTGKQILLLGAGGAARGIIAPIFAAKIAALTLVNRNVEKAKALQLDFPQITCRSLPELHASYDLIINATSASLTDPSFSLPASLLHSSSFCYDLVYNIQAPTPFTSWAYQQGCTASDGLGMLVEQAAEAFYIWHGVMPDTQSVMVQLRKCQ